MSTIASAGPQTAPVSTVNVVDPAGATSTVCRRIYLPPAGGDVAPEQARFDVVAIWFPTGLDEDDAETAAGLFGYAWTQHGSAVASGHVSDHPVHWPLSDVGRDLMVVHADMGRRRNRSRTPQQATSDLFHTFLRYLTDGTPRRADGGRLIEPLFVDPWVSDLVTIYVNDPTSPAP